MSLRVSELLRISRIASIPKNSSPLTPNGPKIHPTHQIIESKPTTLEFQEWGLKAPLPQKIKSQFAIFNDLDTLERLTTFEPRGSSQWNRIRFQEMGVAPTYGGPMTGRRSNPLFWDVKDPHEVSHPWMHSVSLSQRRMEQKKILNSKLEQLRSKRSEFRRWILENEPEAFREKNFTDREVKDLGPRFLHDQLKTNQMSPETFFQGAQTGKVIGTGGLTYNYKGRLKNSPNGILQKTVVPGRIVRSQGSTDEAMALGGFIGKIRERSTRAVGDAHFRREHVYTFAINGINTMNDGSVEIKASQVDSAVIETRKQSQLFSNHQYSKVRHTQSHSKASHPTENFSAELLELLEDPGKR